MCIDLNTNKEKDYYFFIRSLVGNSSVKVNLMDCVEKTKEVTKAMAEKKWDLAVELRGKSFLRNLETYRMLSKNKPRNYTNEEIETKNLPLWERRISKINESDLSIALEQFKRDRGRTLAVMHVGAPCCGMNAAVRSFVRTCISGGHRPLGIQNGVEGILTQIF